MELLGELRRKLKPLKTTVEIMALLSEEMFHFSYFLFVVSICF